LAAALERLLRDPERRRAMGTAGRLRVEAGLGHAAMVDAIEGVYPALR
jgi:glycosyltransferase involved in cell wall biosynthesis